MLLLASSLFLFVACAGGGEGAGSGTGAASNGGSSLTTTSAVVTGFNSPVQGNAENRSTFSSYNPTDVDMDDDGLIEIYTIEMLSNIRNDLDGSHYNDGSTSINTGCKAGGCNGYELVRNLDFTAANSYTAGTANANYVPAATGATATQGWLPLSNSAGNANFTGIFEGNGHHIHNLYINRPASTTHVGLFRGSAGVVRHLFLHVNVTGKNYVGGLMGDNSSGIIQNVLVTGTVTGGTAVGGLSASNSTGIIQNVLVTGTVVGKIIVGGLVGQNSGIIDSARVNNVLAAGNVTCSAGSNIGGLMGVNGTSLHNALATGAVNGNCDLAGGFVSYNASAFSTINNALATGAVTNTRGGTTQVGGLAGGTQLIARTGESAVTNGLTNAFWNSATTTQTTGYYTFTSSNGVASTPVANAEVGKTTVELQTAASAFYTSWKTGDKSGVKWDATAHSSKGGYVLCTKNTTDCSTPAWLFEDGKYPRLNFTAFPKVPTAGLNNGSKTEIEFWTAARIKAVLGTAQNQKLGY